MQHMKKLLILSVDGTRNAENEIEKSLGKIPMCAHEAMLKWDVRAAV